MKKVIKSSVWWVHWHKYAEAYLALAHIGVIELQEQKYRKGRHFSEFEKSLIYTDKTLLVPIIWNMKHAIELILKALANRITKEFSTTHANPELSLDLRMAFKSLKITNHQLLDEIIELSNKYYKLEFCESISIRSGNIEDTSNDIFRYPESMVNFNLGIDKFHEITNEQISELGEDLVRLRNLLLRLDNLIVKAKLGVAKPQAKS